MNSYWFVLDSLLPNTFCDYLVGLHDQMNTARGEYGDGVSDMSYRDSEILGLGHGTEENERIHDVLKNYVISANSECFGFNLNGLSEFQIARYGKHQHYKMHQDMRISGRASVRKLSLSVQLSDDEEYEGGDLVFADWIGSPPQEIIRQKGRIIVFPSFVPHEVKRVISGFRYSLVGWYEGSNFF